MTSKRHITNRQSLQIGGLLVLVGLGILAFAAYIAYLLATTYYPIFSNGTWSSMLNPEAKPYSPLLGPAVLIEAVCYGIMLFYSLYLLYMFFNKNVNFPAMFVVLAVFFTIFVFLDCWAIALVDQKPVSTLFNSAIYERIIKSLIGFILFTPYLFISKRAKATFQE